MSVAEIKATPLSRDETSLLRAVATALAILIFGQKLAVPPNIEIGFFPVVALTGWMLYRGYGGISPVRAIAFLGILAAIYGSILLNPLRPDYSVTAVLFFTALYAPFIVTSPIRRALYLRILLTFQAMALVIAVIVYAQWGQQLLGMAMINMQDHVPKSWLFETYVYLQKIGFHSRFHKPNGFFMLETSHTSQLLGIAVMIELCLFRRLSRLLPLLLAQVSTFGGTGLLLLLLASPVAAFYLRPKTLLAIALAAPLALAAGLQLGVVDNVLGRATEFGRPGTSGNGRFTAPIEIASQTVDADLPAAIFGIGPGVQSRFLDNPTDVLNPASKLVIEYGLIVALAFLLWFHACLFSTGGPFIVAWMMAIQFDLLNGSLLIPLQTYYCLLLSSMFVIRDAPGRPSLLDRRYDRGAIGLIRPTARQIDPASPAQDVD